MSTKRLGSISNCIYPSVVSEDERTDDEDGSHLLRPDYLLVKKDGCSYCSRAIKLIETKNKTVHVFDDITDLDYKLQKQAEGYKYFPKIYEKSGNTYAFVGGYDVISKKKKSAF